MSIASKVVTVAAAVTLVLHAGSCEKLKSKTSDYAAKVCVETASNRRSVQANCNEGREGFRWMYFPGDKIIPSVGGKIPGGSSKEPDVPQLVRIPDNQGNISAQAVATSE